MIQLRESEHVVDPASPAIADGEPVPVTLPPESRQDVVIDFYKERGFTFEQSETIADSLDDLLDEINGDRAINRGSNPGEIVANIFRLLAVQLKNTALDKTPAGRAFRRVMEGPSSNRSLQTDADEIGCTKQAIHAHEKELRGRVCLTGQ